MKTKTKIIIWVCFIFILIGIIVLSGLIPRAKQKQQANRIASNTTSPINNGGTGNEGSEYVKITYEATSQVFKVSGTEKTITVYQDFPTVETNNETVKNKLQTEIGKIANEEFSDYKKQVQDRINDPTGIDSSYMENFGNLSLKWSFENNRNDEKIVSIRNISSGSLGGVSWDSIRGYSFSAETGERLKLDDIAINPDALKKYINQELVKYFRANYQNLGIYPDSLDKLGDKVNIEDLTWYLSNSGLTICIDKYKVSPNTFDYTIKYADLKDLVKEEYIK